MQSEDFNWTGRDFELGKEVALYTIEILKRRINGEQIPIIKNLVEFLKRKVPEKSFNITKGTIGGLLHIPGFFPRIGFDARITTWLNRNPEVAIQELVVIKENILNLKSYDESLNLNFGKGNEKIMEDNNKEILFLEVEEEEELEELEDFTSVTQNDVYVDDADFPIKYLIDDLKNNDIYT